MKEKYGVEHSSQRAEWREKVEKTNEAKFGTKWASQSQSVRDKVNATIIERFGSMEAYKKTICRKSASTKE